MITAMPRIAIAVRDFPATVALFRDVLGMPVVDLSDETVDSLGARLAMCVPEGGSNIELMSPADPSAPLSQSLERFLERRGEGLFALMLEAPDPDAEADELSSRGLDVLPLMAGAGGRDIHPRSSHGVLIRVYPENSFDRPCNDAPKAPHVSGIDRVVVAVHDVARAARVYGKGLGLEVAAPTVDESAGVLRLVCTPPAGGTIELVSPLAVERALGKRISDFLEQRGEGMFALVLHAQDPNRAARALEARGIEVSYGDTIEVRPFGTTIQILESAG